MLTRLLTTYHIYSAVAYRGVPFPRYLAAWLAVKSAVRGLL